MGEVAAIQNSITHTRPLECPNQMTTNVAKIKTRGKQKFLISCLPVFGKSQCPISALFYPIQHTQTCGDNFFSIKISKVYLYKHD